MKNEGLYIKKGERVTTESGETICFAAQDITGLADFSFDHYHRWERDILVGDVFSENSGFKVDDLSSTNKTVIVCIEGEWRHKLLIPYETIKDYEVYKHYTGWVSTVPTLEDIME